MINLTYLVEIFYFLGDIHECFWSAYNAIDDTHEISCRPTNSDSARNDAQRIHIPQRKLELELPDENSKVRREK